MVKDSDNQTIAQKCVTCDDGYYYDTTNNICKEGWVSNCKSYEDNVYLKCSACLDNYSKLDFTIISSNQEAEDQSNIDRDYCMQIPSTAACS